MSTAPKRKPASYEDLLQVPEHMVAEILDGDLYASPRPSFPHARAASGVGGLLFEKFDRPASGGEGPGGWWILDEPELHLRDDVVVPDLAGWRRTRLPTFPSGLWLDLSPDWVCEVASPSTEAIDRGRKLRIYVREGVGHLWLLNPKLRTLEVYRRSDDKWIVLETFVGNEAVRAEPFDEVELDMSRWWPPEAPESA
jgi:Uma2 family endonuclease